MSSVRWEPSCLTFPIALNKAAVVQLRGKGPNEGSAVFSFKVKTTNPKRYSVRPNVGVVWPGQEAVVTVQLPGLKELPPDLNKCKDKFQVLTLPLDPATVDQLQSMTADKQREALTGIWASNNANDATVDKIKCAFSLDSSYRDAPIPEEEGPVAPYSPEATPAPTSESKSTPAPPQTPYVESMSIPASGGEEVAGSSDAAGGAAGSGGSASPPKGAATPKANKQIEGALEVAAVKEQLHAAEGQARQLKGRAEKAEETVVSLEEELAKTKALNKSLQQKAKAGTTTGDSATSNATGGGGGGGFGAKAVLLLALAGFLSGVAVGWQTRSVGAAVTGAPAKPTSYTAPTGARGGPRRGKDADEL